MATNMDIHYSSADPTWETPADLFAVLDKEFGFELDVCAQPATAKCGHYFTPEINGLAQVWQGVCFMNPPYGRQIGGFCKTPRKGAFREGTSQEGHFEDQLMPFSRFLTAHYL